MVEVRLRRSIVDQETLDAWSITVVLAVPVLRVPCRLPGRRGGQRLGLGGLRPHWGLGKPRDHCPPRGGTELLRVRWACLAGRRDERPPEQQQPGVGGRLRSRWH